MPAEYSIDVARRIVISRGWGTLTDADLLANREVMAADPAFDPHFSQLWDFAAVTALEVTSSAVRSLAMMRSPFDDASRRALVVSTDVQHGMARMFALASGKDDNDTLRVFRDMAAAREWLGI